MKCLGKEELFLLQCIPLKQCSGTINTGRQREITRSKASCLRKQYNTMQRPALVGPTFLSDSDQNVQLTAQCTTPPSSTFRGKVLVYIFYFRFYGTQWVLSRMRHSVKEKQCYLALQFCVKRRRNIDSKDPSCAVFISRHIISSR